MNELANQFLSAVNGIVDSKIEHFNLPSTLSPVVNDASNPPFSITETIVDPNGSTIYFLIDASEDTLMQHLSTPLVINCSLNLQGKEHHLTIKGTITELVSNDMDLKYEAYSNYYTDDHEIKHRAIVLRTAMDPPPKSVVLQVNSFGVPFPFKPSRPQSMALYIKFHCSHALLS